MGYNASYSCKLAFCGPIQNFASQKWWKTRYFAPRIARIIQFWPFMWEQRDFRSKGNTPYHHEWGFPIPRNTFLLNWLHVSDLPYLFRTFFNVVFSMVGSFFRESWCVSILVFSMVFHLQKVSSKNSCRIKSYSCFKTGYKWRHLLPVYLVPEGFYKVTAVSRVYMTKIPKQSGQKRQSNQRRQKSSLGLIWG